MIRGHILFPMSGLDGGTSKPFCFCFVGVIKRQQKQNPLMGDKL